MRERERERERETERCPESDVVIYSIINGNEGSGR